MSVGVGKVNGMTHQARQQAEAPLGEYLRSEDVLRLLPISQRSLERLKRRGQIPYIRAGGGRLILFKKADVSKALDRLTVRG